MKTLFNFGYFIILLGLITSCNAQTKESNISLDRNEDKLVGGPFENGEFMYIGMPDKINSVDTSAGWTQNGQKLLITGTIFKTRWQDSCTKCNTILLSYRY